MTIDGKKKWTVALIAVIGTIVAQFAPEQADTIMGQAKSLAPLLMGGIYVIAQWLHDNKKEVVKAEQEKTKQAQTTAITTTQAETLAEVEEEVYYEPFDKDAFEARVKARASTAYFVNNPLTEFQASRDKALITVTRNVEKAKSFWFYHVHKGLSAFEYLFGFPYAEAGEHLTLKGKAGKDCSVPDLAFLAIELGEGHYKLLGALESAQRILAQVSELEHDMVAWVHPQTGVPQRWTLWTVGTRAREILASI